MQTTDPVTTGDPPFTSTSQTGSGMPWTLLGGAAAFVALGALALRQGHDTTEQQVVVRNETDDPQRCRVVCVDDEETTRFSHTVDLSPGQRRLITPLPADGSFTLGADNPSEQRIQQRFDEVYVDTSVAVVVRADGLSIELTAD
ncbi:MAG: hypothetical protein ABEI77_03650 [Halorientalis sp.]